MLFNTTLAILLLHRINFLMLFKKKKYLRKINKIEEKTVKKNIEHKKKIKMKYAKNNFALFLISIPLVDRYVQAMCIDNTSIGLAFKSNSKFHYQYSLKDEQYLY